MDDTIEKPLNYIKSVAKNGNEPVITFYLKEVDYATLEIYQENCSSDPDPIWIISVKSNSVDIAHLESNKHRVGLSTIEEDDQYLKKDSCE